MNIGVILTPDRLLLFIMLFAFAMGRRHERRLPGSTLAARMLGYLLVLFALIGVTSWWASGADTDSSTYAELTHLYCLAFLPALSYFLAKRLDYTEAMLKQMLRFFAVLGVYLTVTAICEHFQITALIFPKYILDPHAGIHFGRSRGPFVDTIGNGGMLLVSFLAITCISSSSTGLRRFVFVVLALLVVPAVYFTETRAVWLGMGAITVTLFALRTPMRGTGVIIVVVILLAFVGGIGSKFSIFENTLFSRRQNTVEARFDNYEIAWNAFRAHPVVGLGYGTLKQEWSDYFDRNNSRLGLGLDDGNHSTMLGILAELGLTGAIPYVALLACAAIVCVSAYRDLRHGHADFERLFAVVALGAVEAYFVLSLTNDLKSQPTVNVSAFWLVGVVASVHSARLASKRTESFAEAKSDSRRASPTNPLRSAGTSRGALWHSPS